MGSSELEKSYVRDSYAALSGYIAHTKHPHWLYLVVAIIGLAGVALATLVALASNYLLDWMRSIHVSGHGAWSYYVNNTVVGSAELMLAAIVATVPLAKYIACRWPILAEFMGKGTVGLTLDEDDTEEKYARRVRWEIEAAVRAGLIGPGRKFDPATFVRERFVRNRRRWLFATLVLASIGAYLLYNDIRSYQLYTNSGIVSVDYWTHDRRSFAYDEVVKVSISCIVRSEEKEAYLRYGLHLPDGSIFRFPMLENRLLDLADHERITQRLSDAGVPLIATGKHASTVDGGVALSRACRQRLDKIYDPSTMSRLFAIFHIVPGPD